MLTTVRLVHTSCTSHNAFVLLLQCFWGIALLAALARQPWSLCCTVDPRALPPSELKCVPFCQCLPISPPSAAGNYCPTLCFFDSDAFRSHTGMRSCRKVIGLVFECLIPLSIVSSGPSMSQQIAAFPFFVGG